MRVFWAIVLVLLVVGGVAAFVSSPSTGTKQPSDPAAPRVIEDGYVPSTLTPAAPASPQAAPEQAKPSTPTAPPVEVDLKADLANAISNAVSGSTPVAPAPLVDGVPFELPTHPAFPPEKITASKAVKAGNQIVIDGQYRVSGSGTAADPYVVPFELLMSAADVYDPRKGLTKMPQRIAFLHEKHIKLPGYIAFPISSTDPKEMLVLFNQWDGCCIGVPPTAYDAVETKLAKPATGDDKFITYGSTTGVFKVDPYVDNGWLLGLYLLEDATLTDVKHEPASPKQMPEDEN